MNKAEGRTDCVAQGQSSVEGSPELKAKADTLFYTHSFFSSFILHERAFCFWDAVVENPSGLHPSGGGGWGCVPKALIALSARIGSTAGSTNHSSGFLSRNQMVM